MANTAEHYRARFMEKAATLVVGAFGVAFGAGVTWSQVTHRVDLKADQTTVDALRVDLTAHERQQSQEMQDLTRRLKNIERMTAVLVCDRNPRDFACRLTPVEDR